MERYDEFRRAYEQARVELTKIPSVVGIGHGPKRVAGAPTGDYAIIAYVDQKLPLDQLPAAERVPATFQGWAVDVVVPDLGDDHAHGEVGAAHAAADDDDSLEHAHSHDGMWLDWAKLHEQRAQVGIAAAPLPILQPANSNVAIVPDDGRLVLKDGRVDFVAAFQRFKARYGDDYDFVSFFIDTASGMPYMGTFHSGIYNQTKGINYYAGERLNARGGWGSRTLQAFHCFSFINLGALLQEMGHMWGGYVTVKYRADDPDFHFDLLIGDNRSDINQVAHWGRAFNDQNSPMDYDGVNWSDNGDGTFRLGMVSDEVLEFCDLDLYLMGLLPSADAKPFYVLKNSMERGEGLFAAERLDLTVQNVVWAHGARVPAQGQTQFKQAFVVLTKSADGATAFADEVEQWRRRYEAAFLRATRSKARVDTRLTLAPPNNAPANPLASLFVTLADALRRWFGR